MVVSKAAHQRILEQPTRHLGEDVKLDRWVDLLQGHHDGSRPRRMAEAMWRDKIRNPHRSIPLVYPAGGLVMIPKGLVTSQGSLLAAEHVMPQVTAMRQAQGIGLEGPRDCRPKTHFVLHLIDGKFRQSEGKRVLQGNTLGQGHGFLY